MRINENSKNLADEKYSEFYNSLKGAIDKVLNSRPIHLETLNTYVNVEKSEKILSHFFWQNDKSTAIFKGSQGTGKSSTIFFMHKKFLGNRTTSSIYFDMRQHQGKIPSQIWKIKELEDRADALTPKVRDLLSSRFATLADNIIEEKNIDEGKVNWEVFRYSIRYHHQIIPQKFRGMRRSRISEEIDNELLKEVEEELSRDYSFQSMFHFIKYAYVLNTLKGKKRVAIFIDNIDQMPYATLEAAIACSNSFSSCANGSMARGVLLGKIKFRFIIACRHHNYERLVERAHLNSFGANNHFPINHDNLPSLNQIVSKRLARVKKFGEYRFKKGIKIVEVDTKKCIKAYFKQLEDSGTYRQLLLINNNNLAFTLDTIQQITQNRYFPAFDEFVENFQFGTKANTTYLKPVNAAIAAACMIWGNPDSVKRTIYPALPSKIPNLLAWDGVDRMSFLLPFRIILLLKRLGANSDSSKLISIAFLYQNLSQCFPVSQQLYLTIIASMQRTRLLISYAEEGASVINSYRSLKLSPRSEYMINYGTRYEAVALGFLEDIYIDKPNSLFEKPEIGKSLRFQSDTVKAGLIKYCYDLEYIQLEVLKNNGLLEKYFSLFPQESLVDMLISGLKVNIEDIDKNNAVAFTNSLESINSHTATPLTMEDMIEIASKRAAFPNLFERGTQLMGELRAENSDDPRIGELHRMLAELRSDLEQNKPVSSDKKTTILKRLNEFVSYGRSGEKVVEWTKELFDAIDSATPYLSNL